MSSLFQEVRRKKPTRILAAMGFLALWTPCSQSFCQTSYMTDSGVLAQGISTTYLATPGSYAYGNSSSTAYSGIDQSNGFTLSVTGDAEASEGALHSAISYTLTPPALCSSPCMPTGGNGAWGGNASAHWFEYGVQAYNTGPLNLIPDIVTYEFTWNIDGTLFGPEYDASAYLAAQIIQGTYQSNPTYATYYADPIGPVSFYLEPPNPETPFTFMFDLQTSVISNNPAVSYESANFYNTAIIASVVALDAQGNVLPGVELQLENGDLLGSSGLVSPSATPEPPAYILCGSGLLLLVYFRSRIQSANE